MTSECTWATNEHGQLPEPITCVTHSSAGLGYTIEMFVWQFVRASPITAHVRNEINASKLRWGIAQTPNIHTRWCWSIFIFSWLIFVVFFCVSSLLIFFFNAYELCKLTFCFDCFRQRLPNARKLSHGIEGKLNIVTPEGILSCFHL